MVLIMANILQGQNHFIVEIPRHNLVVRLDAKGSGNIKTTSNRRGHYAAYVKGCDQRLPSALYLTGKITVGAIGIPAANLTSDQRQEYRQILTISNMLYSLSRSMSIALYQGIPSVISHKCKIIFAAIVGGCRRRVECVAVRQIEDHGHCQDQFRAVVFLPFARTELPCSQEIRMSHTVTMQHESVAAIVCEVPATTTAHPAGSKSLSVIFNRWRIAIVVTLCRMSQILFSTLSFASYVK